LRTVGSPIFAGFFVIAGYSLHVEDLSHMGLVGGTYVVLRIAGKVVGCRVGLRRAHVPDRIRGSLGPALLSLAAVQIGLASFVEQAWVSPVAKQFATIILGSVVIFELIGPLLLKRCVVLAGEVKAITLLRRPGVSAEGASIVGVTLKAVMRLFRQPASAEDEPAQDLTVEHIMRSNPQMIPASASLDEVLHFIERSTYSHFPVVRANGDLAGVIHFSDVRDVMYDPTLRALVTAVDFADSESPIVPMNMPLTDLLDLFTEQNVAVLPVSDRPQSRRVVGMVEQRDLLRTLHIQRDSD
jgi:CBS domain-containing protein